MADEISIEELMMMDTAAQLTTHTGIVVTVHQGKFKIGRQLLTIDEMVVMLTEQASFANEAGRAVRGNGV